MLDKLELHIPFKREFLKTLNNGESFYIPVQDLPDIELTSDIIRDDDGKLKIERLRTKFESLPSSHASMACKVYDSGLNCDPFVAISCSPCKIVQGHNLFGFDCMEKSAKNMLWLLAYSFGDLYSMLDIENTSVSQFDITYSSFVENEQTRLLLIDHLKNTAQGQTKNRGDAYASTSYFGSKNSRVKRLKVYLKHLEMVGAIKKARSRNQNVSADIMEGLLETEFCRSAVRFEATIMRQYLERRGVPANLFKLLKYIEETQGFYTEMWQLAWSDVFKALSGQTVTNMNDDNIYNEIHKVHSTVSATGKITVVKVNRLFSFFQTMKTLGYDHLKKMTTASTFYRNVSDLLDCGFSKSFLQNLDKKSGCTVIPMTRMINIDFGSQFPENYVEAVDLWEAA